jgi:methyltransferase
MAHDKRMKAREPAEVFNLYLNTCPAQGSRTIRTEEAVLISMGFLQAAVARFGER